MPEEWSTKEDISAALARFEAGIAGWVTPAAHGIATVDGTFITVNIAEHSLPAVVLATVLGHRGGTASYPVTTGQLGRAIELLAPAEACADYDHPNLAAWRRIHASAHGPGPAAAAVFLANLDDQPVDAATRRFRELIIGADSSDTTELPAYVTAPLPAPVPKTRRTWPLAALAALLALWAIVATGGFVVERSAHEVTKAELATQTATVDRQRKELAASRAKVTELEAKLRAAEKRTSSPLDPKQILECLSGDVLKNLLPKQAGKFIQVCPQ
jgi:hypothetical protein